MRTLELIDYIFILLILKMNPSRLWCVCLNWGALQTDARGSFDFTQANRERIHHVSNYGTGFWFRINIGMNQQKNAMFKHKLRLPIEYSLWFDFFFIFIWYNTFQCIHAADSGIIDPIFPRCNIPWNTAKINVFLINWNCLFLYENNIDQSKKKMRKRPFRNKINFIWQTRNGSISLAWNQIEN